MLKEECSRGPPSDARLKAAIRNIQAGDAGAALAPLLDILSRFPFDWRARYTLAGARLRCGDPAAALAEFQTLLDQVPAHDGAAYGRGLALFALGERLPALGVFRRLTRPGPFARKAWESIADITPDEAERMIALNAAADELVAISARSSAASDRRAAAAALMAAGRPAEAAALLAPICGPLIGAAPPDRLLARAFYLQGHFEAAFAEASRLLADTKAADKDRIHPPAFHPDTAGKVLAEILEMLSSAGATAFLAAGTLLGFHRSGTPLAHDRDIDIGVLRDPDGGPDIAAILRAHDNILLPRISRPNDRYFGVQYKGIAVDIFLYEPDDGLLTCGFSTLEGDIQWRFKEFEIEGAVYGDRQWPVPACPERYLSETYGPGWRVPDRGFASAISSPALYRTDIHARAYYAAIRARAARLAGDTEKAFAVIRQSPVQIRLPAIGEEYFVTPAPA